MKILLAACNAKYIHSNLAVYDLRAYASAYQEHILLGEYTINQTKDEILKDIYLSGADVVCFSCYIWNISFVRDLLEDLHKILPDVKFWTGGPEVSFDAEAFLRRTPQVTGVMVGEGEKTFLELVRYYVDGVGTLSEIPGIAYREGEEIHHNGWRELTDLSEIPFVYEHLEDFENKIIYYESSRGCPFSCSYCLSSIDKKLRFRDLDLVKKELQFFLDHRVPQVKFVDRTFNCKHEHAMTIWKYILEHDNGITNFHFEVSADLLRDEEMQLMSKMRPGLIQLEIGVQSTNPDTIHAIHRHMDLDKLERCVAKVHSFGGQFQNTLEYLVPQFADAFTFYEKLGAFYEKKGYSEISHSRMRRYEILLEFLREETDLDADVAAQHMLYDLYLREKLKKRPSFAADQKPYESAVWTYRKKHKISKTAHIEVFPDGTTILFDYENRNPLSNNAHTETIELGLDNIE